jgi:glycosyltransferase involved in cell wall biosynthesis
VHQTAKRSFKSISIITACLNCRDYIQETLKSVADQGYPNLEYIVIDGGSTDGTLEIVERFSSDIDIFMSEPDEGQYHAVQKGFNMSHGDIMAWINADDIYLPWTFAIVDNIFTQFPDVDWIMGRPCTLNKAGQSVSISAVTASYPGRLIKSGIFRSGYAGHLQQESMFWRRSLWEKAGGFNLDLKYAADYDLWTRFSEYSDLFSVDAPLACFRYRPGEQRSSMNNYYSEEVEMVFRGLKQSTQLWTMFGGSGSLLRNLGFCFAWGKAPVIRYSLEKDQWFIEQVKRPPSKMGLINTLFGL